MNRKDEGQATAVSGQQIVPLLEEEVSIEKRDVSTGRVRIRTVADSKSEVVSTTLDEEQVEVRRVAMNRVVTEAPAIRTEGGITIIPVMEEVLVVEKQLVLREELHVTRRTTSETVEIPVTLRTQHAVIERLDADGLPTERGE